MVSGVVACSGEGECAFYRVAEGECEGVGDGSIDRGDGDVQGVSIIED